MSITKMIFWFMWLICFLILCRPHLDFEILEGFKLFEFLVGMAAAVYLWRVLTEGKK